MANAVIEKTTGLGKAFYETENNENCFRFVHDDNEVIRFWEGDGYTGSGLKLEVAETQAAAESRMVALGLEVVELETDEHHV